MKKIGVYGGTFNPIHRGHEKAAVQFYDGKNLDELLIIPAYSPPHKKIDGDIPAQKRLEMCTLAFSGDIGAERNIIISDIEIKKGGVSYSYDLLNLLREKYIAGEYEILFLCGSDMFMSIESWYRYSDFLSMCTLVVACREENGKDKNAELMNKGLFYEKQGKKIEFLENDTLEVSSSKIRCLIKNKASDSELLKYLSPAVLNFIKSENLYID